MKLRRMLASTLILSSCAVVSPMRTGASILLKPQILQGSYATKTTVTPYTQASIDHLVLKLYTFDTSEHDQGIQKSIPGNQLGNTITFTNLKNNTTYRIKALAYASSDESLLISTEDINSYTDVTVTTDDRPTISPLKVRLKDINFNGQGTGSIQVTNGGYTYGSTESCFIPYVVTTLAGNGAAGALDGTGTAATFNHPDGGAADAAGNIYIADTNNHRIRKITPAGVVTTYAGNGQTAFADGTGTAATFQGPTDVAIDTAGNLFVIDSDHCLVRKIDTNRVVTTIAGSGVAGFADGTGTSASFKYPSGITVDSAGIIYVADTDNHRIRRIDANGVVTTLAGNGGTAFTNGIGTAATFNRPYGISADTSGNLYVADQFNHRIRKIDTNGVVTTVAGNGVGIWLDGTGTAAGFASPLQVKVGVQGNLFVVDEWSARIRKVDQFGVVTTIAGNGNTTFTDGIGTSATFWDPRGLAIDRFGNIYVGDYFNNRVRRIR